jgi:NitT/TauT family transport system substrate-binding protein
MARSAGEVRSVLLAVACLAACAPLAQQPGAGPVDAPVAPIVKVGSGGSLYDAALLLAVSRGYFASEGLSVQVVSFSSPAGVLPPVVAGQLDVGTTPPNVDLFDALALDRAPPRIVASAGQALPGYSPAALLLRPDLTGVSAQTLRGRPIGADLYGPGGRNVLLALTRLGLTRQDVYLVDLPPDDAARALGESQLDAAYAVDPDVATLVAHGRATRWIGVDELDPGQELAVLLFSPNLSAHRPTVAVRLLAAYLRAVREYRVAAADPDTRASLRRELAPSLDLDDPLAVPRLSFIGYPSDAVPNLVSLAATQEHYLRYDFQRKPADLTRAIDLSFLAAAQ